jgi:hypothetical protein
MPQSEIRVNTIRSNKDATNDPVIFPYGLEVGAGYALTCGGGINVVGVLSAAQYNGDGYNVTGLPGVTVGATLAITTLL